jgi:toxin ParE1/3/4
VSFQVILTAGAARDLADIDEYLDRSAGPRIAIDTLGRLERRCEELGQFPERGNIPPELEALGIRDYRELHERPYRIIYRVVGSEVVVYIVADGRRDFRSLLEQRLLR